MIMVTMVLWSVPKASKKLSCSVGVEDRKDGALRSRLGDRAVATKTQGEPAVT